MNKLSHMFLTLFGIAALSGCALMEVSSDWDSTEDFSKFKTYAWASDKQAITGNPQLDNDLLDKRIRSAVDRDLQAKGFQKTPDPNPDFLVSYKASVEGKLDVTNVPGEVYESPWSMPDGTVGLGWDTWGAASFVTQYDEGTVLLDVADAKTKKLVWRGSVSAVVGQNLTPEEKQQRIDEAIQKVLVKFPPKKK
ncbi:MAG: DUF4136 domain-containing protein [Candidatus Omnitrophica bacterium]|nr:DUF4136 domain-containing protein [Candidatus Omnitrophota bacterium]MDD5670460.1 DUF4136 domain-containing protein [Candidatus Omnitrophota bacterium]